MVKVSIAIEEFPGSVFLSCLFLFVFPLRIACALFVRTHTGEPTGAAFALRARPHDHKRARPCAAHRTQTDAAPRRRAPPSAQPRCTLRRKQDSPRHSPKPRSISRPVLSRYSLVLAPLWGRTHPTYSYCATAIRTTRATPHTSTATTSTSAATPLVSAATRH